MTQFVHLRLHTEYSLLDGIVRVPELMTAVAAAIGLVSVISLIELLRLSAFASGPEAPGEVMIGGRVQIPMELTRHVPVIEAKVNGKGPFHFAVDSGFGGMMQITPELAEQLSLPVIGEGISGDPSGKNQRRAPPCRAGKRQPERSPASDGRGSGQAGAAPQ